MAHSHSKAHGHSHDHDHDDVDHDHAHSKAPKSPAKAKSPAGHDHDGAAHPNGHGHSHDLRDVPEKKLRFALAATIAFMLVEIVFGVYARSLTLTSDAGHLFADAGALLLALIAQRFASRRATPARTYGFRRSETLAAFLNGAALTVTAVVIVREAWERWQHPSPVRGGIVVLVGSIGLLVNLGIAWSLARGQGHNLNTRAALAHVVFDAIGSLVAIASGLLAWQLGWMRVDAVLSVPVAILILVGGWIILKRALAILMEGTPIGLDVIELEKTIRNTPGVADLHDLHAWTISEGFDSVTVHVVLSDGHHGTEVARVVGERIRDVHHVGHVTVQPEARRVPDLRPPRSLLHKPN